MDTLHIQYYRGFQIVECQSFSRLRTIFCISFLIRRLFFIFYIDMTFLYLHYIQTRLNYIKLAGIKCLNKSAQQQTTLI